MKKCIDNKSMCKEKISLNKCMNPESCYKRIAWAKVDEILWVEYNLRKGNGNWRRVEFPIYGYVPVMYIDDVSVSEDEGVGPCLGYIDEENNDGKLE